MACELLIVGNSVQGIGEFRGSQRPDRSLGVHCRTMQQAGGCRGELGLLERGCAADLVASGGSVSCHHHGLTIQEIIGLFYS
jgi:hypothetical protein